MDSFPFINLFVTLRLAVLRSTDCRATLTAECVTMGTTMA
jgi:hypothetical protein